MKHLKKILFFIVIVYSYSYGQNYIKGELIVQLNQSNREFEKELYHSELKNYKIIIQNQISKNFNIWLISFDKNINHFELVKKINRLKSVTSSQVNHFVSERATNTNDSMFNSQWHHQNTGQNQGTIDADIDTPEAWDITTGGVSAFGDTIVACIIERHGGDLNHEDLKKNAWKNYNEIPNNNIDDDGNGYVDDYLGWNVNLDNDNIGNGNHGTQVAGMIGAVGNNNIGISGVNWNVKLMMIRGHNGGSEASVIEAYDYPLTMRKLYSKSNGKKGAFVVVTNASWGINNANPNDYPLWNNIYDTLGKYGILNVAATTNNNSNVDVVGDMPTGSTSNYLIGVTATDKNDERNLTGYGSISIDLAAPGVNVNLTRSNNSYGNNTGTSFASPCVAGVISLLYASPCYSFMNVVYNNPQAACDSIKKYILDGVDEIPSLQNKTVTGGRLNTKNSIELLMNNCDNTMCISAFNIGVENVSDTSAKLFWNGIHDSYSVKYKKTNATNWTTINTDTNHLFLYNLELCQEYQYKIISQCNQTTNSNESEILSFKTNGCCENSELIPINYSNHSIELTWENVLAADSYHLRYKDTLSQNWIELNNVTSPYTIENLDTCSTYEINQKVSCKNNSKYSNSIFLDTKGCGSCKDANYCEVIAGNSSLEFINKVEINTTENESGNNNGKAFFDELKTTLRRGKKYKIIIEPGYTGFNFTQKFFVYIDLNQDGVFNETNELVLNKTSNSTITDSIEIPENSKIGLTRMRIIMIATNSISQGPCNNLSYNGEVEEYCIKISNVANIISKKLKFNTNLKIYPNPNNGEFFINTKNKIKEIHLSSIDGKIIQKWIGKVNNYKISQNIKGFYFVHIIYENKKKEVRKILIQK